MSTHSARPATCARGDTAAAAHAAVEVIYYTDPLCCWSWGFEPQWRLLRFAFAGRLAWRYRMGGMIRSWGDFQDAVNAIYRPAQMGPLWLQARHISGMPLDPGLWINDQPSSSWPACVMVKAAELQSPAAAELVLRRLREAVMTRQRNIARPEILRDIARECAEIDGNEIDLPRLLHDMEGRAARGNFMEDLKNARFREIGRFPAFVIRRPQTAGKVIVGWRPFEALLETVMQVAPELGRGRRPRTEDEYLSTWPEATKCELDQALGVPPADATL